MATRSLSCSVCLEMYTDPRVLPCLHVYCLHCIEGLVIDSNVTCPQCRAKHPVQHNQVNFPVDLLILSSLEDSKGESREEKKICGFCTEGDAAKGYCGDCQEYLCQYCWNVHKRSKMFLRHKVLPADEVSLSKAPAVFKHPATCISHPEYKLEVYCKTCVSLVCCKCILGSGHKGHENALIEEAKEEVKEKMQSLAEAALSNEPYFEFCTKLMKKIEEIAHSKQEELRNKIKTFIEVLTLWVEEAFTEDNKRILAASNDLQMILSQIKSSQPFNTQIQEKVGNEQYLSLINQVLRCLVKINETDKTSSLESVWNINSIDKHFKEKVESIVDLNLIKKIEEDEFFLVSDKDEEDEIFSNENIFSEDNLFSTDNFFSVGGIFSESINKKEKADDVFMLLTAKPVIIIYQEKSIKAQAVFDHPFAELAKWSCASVYYPDCLPSTEVVNSNTVEVKFDVAAGLLDLTGEATFLFHLSPQNIPSFIVEFKVTVMEEELDDEQFLI